MCEQFLYMAWDKFILNGTNIAVVSNTVLL